MNDGDIGFTGSLSKLLDSPAGQGMDPTSLLCMLGLLTVQTIMTVVQKTSDRQSSVSVSEAVKKAGPDLQSLVQALSGALSGQGGQPGPKVNPAALLALLNTIASQVDKGGAPKQDQKADEPAPARLEHRADARRAQADSALEQRDPRTPSSR